MVLITLFPRQCKQEQSGAVEACWAHNPEVRGSKPRSAKFFKIALKPVLFIFVTIVQTLIKDLEQ